MRRLLALLILLLAWPAAAQTADAVPRWTDADIGASLIETPGATALPHRPRWSADPMNLFIVVGSGDGQLSLVDGERFEVLHRAALHHTPLGAPQFSPDGRFAYFASRRGWITKFDLWNLVVAAEVRAGLELRDIALSSDGLYMLVANQAPHSVVLLDAALRLVKSWAAGTRDGKRSSRVDAVRDAAPRRSFIVALQDVAELWEISYNPKVEDIYEGLVHDFRMGEGLPMRGFLNAKRSLLTEPLEGMFIDPEGIHALGIGTAADGRSATLQVVNLDVRRRIASVPLSSIPQPGSAIAAAWHGSAVLLVRGHGSQLVDVIDAQTWRPRETLAVPAPGADVLSDVPEAAGAVRLYSVGNRIAGAGRAMR